MQLPKGLVHTTDEDPGITRRRRGKGWSFQTPEGKTITSAEEKKRLSSLAVPPAYKDVWYCPLPNGHLQATGFDEKSRKQYRYHPDWTEWRENLKFEGLLEFGLTLPGLRSAMNYALKGDGLTRDRILGAVVKLLDRTAARIGNEQYYRENGTAGLTTLRKKHAETEGNRIHLSYRAKSGKDREFDLNHPTLSKIIDRMEDLPGQRLFQYRDGDAIHPIDSTQVNEWLKEKSGIDGISAKYFRTWHASRLTLADLLSTEPGDTKTARIRRETEVLKSTSKVLGHRPPVFKSTTFTRRSCPVTAMAPSEKCSPGNPLPSVAFPRTNLCSSISSKSFSPPTKATLDTPPVPR